MSKKLDAIRQASYFSGLGDELIERLSEGAALRRYQRGEVLFWADNPCTGLHIIRSGIVKLFKTSQQGWELIINVIEEGQPSTRCRSSITVRTRSMRPRWIPAMCG